MFDAKVALAKIANRVLDTYNTNEGWVRLDECQKNMIKDIAKIEPKRDV